MGDGDCRGFNQIPADWLRFCLCILMFAWKMTAATEGYEFYCLLLFYLNMVLPKIVELFCLILEVKLNEKESILLRFCLVKQIDLE